MIKVIVGYRVKKDRDIKPLLLKLRMDAMQYPGFVGAENLVNRKDSSVIVVISAWERPENWIAWEKSKVRAELIKEIEPLIQDQTRVAIYDIIPTTKWAQFT
jgi:antibiotic biosynthesis monooxygenase (ABM) superfamily enzyme